MMKNRSRILLTAMMLTLLTALCSCGVSGKMAHEVLSPVFIHTRLCTFGSENYRQCRPLTFQGEYYVPVEAIGNILYGKISIDENGSRMTVTRSASRETAASSDFLNAREPRGLTVSAGKRIPLIVDGKKRGTAKVICAGETWYVEAERIAELCDVPFRLYHGTLVFGELPGLTANYFSVGQSEVSPYYDGYAVTVDENGKYGLMDSLGEPVLTASYDYLSNLTGNTLAFAQGNQRGVMTLREETVFLTDKNVVSGIADGRCVYRAGDKYGYLDAEGKAVTEAVYDEASCYSGGYAVCRQGEKAFFLNEKGAVSGKTYDQIGVLSNGYAQVMQDGLCGITDETGKPVIPAAYDYVSAYSEGYFVAGRGNKAFLFDESGKRKRTWEAKHASAVKNGLIAVQREDGLCGYLDLKGNWRIPPQFRYASSFEDGYAVVTEGNSLYGLIDEYGNYMLEPVYPSIPLTFHGLTLYLVNDWEEQTYSLINSDGTVLQEGIDRACIETSSDEEAPADQLSNGYVVFEHEEENLVFYLTNTIHY